jgi:uncharacterized delta-60 repeat protein
MRDRLWRGGVAAVIAITGALLGAGAAAASPGSLDTSFGQNGAAIVDFGVGGSINALAVQSDGKILGVGTVLNSPLTQIAVERLTTGGQLDGSYGTGGKTQFGPSGVSQNGYGAALESDGKLLVGGDGALPNGGTNDIEVGRFNTDGSPDASFGPPGSTGLETLNLGADEFVRGMALRPNGQIDVSGYQVVSNAFHQMTAQINNPAGSLDTSFQSTGFDIDPANFSQSLSSGVAVDSGGALFTAAETFASVGAPDDFLPTVIGNSSTGEHPLDLGGDDQVKAVAALPNGDELMAGWTEAAGTLDFAVVALNGLNQDTSFGTKGTTLVDLGGSDAATAMVVQPDGKIILAGTTQSGSNTQVGVVRLQPNGQLDTTFGRNGISVSNLGGIGQLGVSAVALEPDGSIVVGGSVRLTGATHREYLVARFQGDSSGATGGGVGGTGGGGTGGGGTGSGGSGSGGSAVPRCHGKKATIIGNNGKNKLKGTSKNDVIVGLGGNDKIDGGGGNDLICGGSGNDTITGGNGNDTLDGGNGNDKLSGQKGTDSLTGGSGNDRESGGNGNDKLFGNGGKDTLDGGNGNDTVNGGNGNDKLTGDAGNDNLNGGSGTDKLNGGSGKNKDKQ